MQGKMSLTHIYRSLGAIETAMSQHPKAADAEATLVQELTTSGYVSLEVIRAYMSTVQSVYSWNHGMFQLDFWIPVEAVAEWNHQLRRVVRRLETLRLHYRSTKPIHFVCVPLDIPRQFPTSTTQCLGREHVNGGYTYVNGNTVYLFRHEELPKVMLHEYLHQIQGHKDAEWDAKSLERIRALVPIPTGIDIRPNEAVVEAWALYYHTQFLALEHPISFKSLWDAERRFALHQARRVWAHQSKCLPSWNEQTHTFSYYVLKACFVQSLGEQMHKKNTHTQSQPPWQLDYSVPVLVAWIVSQWSHWKAQLVAGTGTGTRTEGADGARMTLLGDF